MRARASSASGSPSGCEARARARARSRRGRGRRARPGPPPRRGPPTRPRARAASRALPPPAGATFGAPSVSTRTARVRGARAHGRDERAGARVAAVRTRHARALGAGRGRVGVLACGVAQLVEPELEPAPEVGRASRPQLLGELGARGRLARGVHADAVEHAARDRVRARTTAQAVARPGVSVTVRTACFVTSGRLSPKRCVAPLASCTVDSSPIEPETSTTTHTSAGRPRGSASSPGAPPLAAPRDETDPARPRRRSSRRRG